MTEGQRNYIKSALLKCAEENENRDYATGHVVVKTVCESAVERIEELEKQVEQMKNCINCSGHSRCQECHDGSKWMLKKKLQKEEANENQ